MAQEANTFTQLSGILKFQRADHFWCFVLFYRKFSSKKNFATCGTQFPLGEKTWIKPNSLFFWRVLDPQYLHSVFQLLIQICLGMS